MIRHFPCGTDIYRSSGYERLPAEPANGGPIDIRCLTKAGEPAPVLTIEADGAVSQIPGVPDFTTAENCYLFSVGPYAAGTQVKYSFSTEPDRSYSFTVSKRVALTKCKALKAADDGIAAVCALEDGTEVCIQLKKEQTGVAISASLGQGNTPGGQIADSAELACTGGVKLSVQREPLCITATNNNGHELVKFDLAQNPLVLDIDAENQVGKFSLALCGKARGLYGFGEKFDAVNQIRKSFTNVTYDHFTQQGKYTYLPMPWFFSDRGWGMLLDTSCIMDFNISVAGDDALIEITSDAATQGLPKMHLLFGEPEELIKSLHALTGPCVLPPAWVFGPWMSANQWDRQAKVDEQLREMKAHDIPATVLVLEAWSDETTFYIFNGAKYQSKAGGAFSWADFKFKKDGLWPDPKGMAKTLNDHGVHLVLWQIPIIKNAAEYDCEQLRIDEREAIENKYCVMNADGTPYRIPDRWFTGSLVLDFTNPKAIEWWMDKRKYLCDELNIEGFKTDGGEFVFDKTACFADGRTGVEMRNAYPIEYTKNYYEFLKRDGRNGILFSRAGYTSAQQYPLHWAGDQVSTFSEMKAQIKAGLSAGLSGIPFWGFDIGGFAGDLPSTDLYLRGTAMGAFCPIMQIHSEPLSGQFGDDNRRSFINDRTPWNMAMVNNDNRILDIYRRFAKLRMKLLPYIEREAKHSVETGRPLMCHLLYDYPYDENVLDLEDEYFFGRSLLVAPVTEEGATQRKVYLPQGVWFDFWTGKQYMGGGEITVDCPLDLILVFSREEGKLLYSDL